MRRYNEILTDKWHHITKAKPLGKT